MKNKNRKNTKPERTEELALMQRIASGDEAAFDEFNEKYYLLVYSTVFKVLNNREDAQEVSNDVLATMWKKAADYHSQKGSLVTWICTTARNRAIDRIRSHQRRSALYDRYQNHLEEDVLKKDVSVSRSVERSDAHQFLQSAVVTLSPEQKEVIELAYFEGMTQREIAEKLNHPLGTVKARIRRGVEQLRKGVGTELKDEAALLLTSFS